MTRETRARGLYSPLDLDEREVQKLATLREMLSFFFLLKMELFFQPVKETCARSLYS